MLDINLFRTDKGGNPELIRESQRSRFAPVELVDEVIALDRAWRDRQFELDKIRQELNATSKKIGKLKASKQEDEAKKLMETTDEIKKRLAAKEVEVQEAKSTLDAKLVTIGNIVHESVPVSDDEANNSIVRTWGERRVGENLKNHVDLCRMLDIVASEKGADVAGGRGYYLKKEGVLLNLALINFGLAFLRKRGFEPMQTPFFMRKETMGKCAQLAQFDEELYKLTGDGEEKYLIATSEQPLCAYHLGDRIYPAELPIRYAGYSTCFRKEAGSHGRDTAGIFRVHQFEKIEQFCVTSPNGNDSWEMHEEMVKNSEDFYKEIGLPYQVVSIVSGALNDAAAKKYDLEAWFPASKTYRELVSCSNCTDYQARRLGIGHGQKKNDEQSKQFVHMLNSTLTATERTLCCILENYQKEDGVEVPKVLQPYMGGIEFLPFKQPLDDKQAADYKSNKSKSKGNAA
ncbi:serine--tRNA ligase-like [Phragmites australis]|uniref:serine--tRNA ligase-like n=1 Tax=Phragmites australis TaxID=29695 RepID=UPI002D7A25DE|nr:serine--tRNA ligase-like [Phragmites australis]